MADIATVEDEPSVDDIERATWRSQVWPPTDFVGVPWATAVVHVPHHGSASEMPPSLEDRMAPYNWARAVRSVSVDLRLHRTRIWFDECAAQGYETLRQTVDIDPHIRGGAPVLKGTRFTVAQTLAELADKLAVEELASEFDLDPTIIRDMLRALSLLLQRPCQR
jgi:uncharacterized protein (DUF433 family)